jgi:hypothetical protein
MTRIIQWIVLVFWSIFLGVVGFSGRRHRPIRVTMLDEPGAVVLAFPGKGGWVGIHEMSVSEPKMTAKAPTKGREIG